MLYALGAVHIVKHRRTQSPFFRCNAYGDDVLEPVAGFCVELRVVRRVVLVNYAGGIMFVSLTHTHKTEETLHRMSPASQSQSQRLPEEENVQRDVCVRCGDVVRRIAQRLQGC